MLRKYLLPMGMLTAVCLLIAIAPGRSSYGTLYIENKTGWDLKVTAKVTDEWDLVTQTNWEIPSNGVEKIDNLWKLSDIRFKPEIEDDAHTANWLKPEHILTLKPHEPVKDLIVSIAKDEFSDKWNIQQLYVSSAKIEYGGVDGYQVKILAR